MITRKFNNERELVEVLENVMGINRHHYLGMAKYDGKKACWLYNDGSAVCFRDYPDKTSEAFELTIVGTVKIGTPPRGMKASAYLKTFKVKDDQFTAIVSPDGTEVLTGVNLDPDFNPAENALEALEALDFSYLSQDMKEAIRVRVSKVLDSIQKKATTTPAQKSGS